MKVICLSLLSNLCYTKFLQFDTWNSCSWSFINYTSFFPYSTVTKSLTYTIKRLDLKVTDCNFQISNYFYKQFFLMVSPALWWGVISQGASASHLASAVLILATHRKQCPASLHLYQLVRPSKTREPIPPAAADWTTVTMATHLPIHLLEELVGRTLFPMSPECFILDFISQDLLEYLV